MDITARAQRLVNTSVQDLASSIHHYSHLSDDDVATLNLALDICKGRGENTKANLIRRKLRQMKEASRNLSNEIVDLIIAS